MFFCYITAARAYPIIYTVQATYDADDNKYAEFNEGYIFTTKWTVNNGFHELGEEITEYVDMSQLRPCSYQKKNSDTDEYETIPLVVLSKTDTSTIPHVEERGINLRQLRAVEANMRRRCLKEGWKNRDGKHLTPETVSLYDVNKYIILPFTEDRKESFVTCLPSTAGPQPPRFFASHWWGEPLVDFIKCLEQAVRDFSPNANDEDDRRGGGLTADTPIWVCAYGNNQHNLADDMSDDPRKSGFTRAMRVAETISVLDKGGVVFDRIWCGYELYLTLVDKDKDKDKNKNEEESDKKGLWAVYTTHPHTSKSLHGGREERESVGIITGGAPADRGSANVRREASFPFHLIKRSLSIKVEKAKASEEIDRIRILNAIIGCGDSNPPPTHHKYDEVNDAVIAAFISTTSTMRLMEKESDDVWQSFLTALSKGKKDLVLMFAGWMGTTANRAKELMSHLPLTVTNLTIWNGNLGVEMIDAVTEHVANTTKLDYLFLWQTHAGGEEGRKAGERLAGAMVVNTSVRSLVLRHTDLVVRENVEQWEAALTSNKTLRDFDLLGVEAEIVEKLREATKDRTPKLKITVISN